MTMIWHTYGVNVHFRRHKIELSMGTCSVSFTHVEIYYTIRVQSPAFTYMTCL